jgi:hypothetical protein
MPTFQPSASVLLPCLLLLVLWARPTHAFGAGNIASAAKIEGQNWRHGDIEDTLLTILMSTQTGKKFSKMDVKRVYFGNWLRDYSQAVDVGTVKFVSAEAIRILLWVLGFLSFGYGTKEFEVTRDRLGCYRPEEHIDNPKDYADNEDARQYDRRLRGPVDENRELAVDPRTGLKNYIASEDMRITTSAGMVRDLFRRCIQLGREANRSGNKADLYEALRLLGTGCHCLEDYSAHSNYVELALIELGERDVFPHVGRNAQFRVQGARGPVYPLVTGTFGGVDFLHSVMGEMNDKATQSEIQELEGAISNSQNKENSSMIKDLLSQLPEGLFGGKDQAGKAEDLESNSQAAQMGNLEITPKEPEAFTQQMNEMVKQIYPIMEWHDEVMQSISEFIENIPILPDLIENVQEQVSIFVFSLLAPYILPIISQVKTELETGSSEVIASSRDKQHIVFQDDNCTDPTHSMLSKDHFSNVLNEPAGRIASEVLKWVVPQIVECWDDDRADEERAIQRIVMGVFHHPALKDYGEDGAAEGRNIMFGVVESWWRDLSQRAKDDLRDKLSRDGVQNGRNHKEGVHDKGHGCGKPLSMANDFSGTMASGGKSSKNPTAKFQKEVGKAASEAVGGGMLGGLVGGLVGGAGASLLGGSFGEEEKKKKKKKEKYDDDGSYSATYSETGRHKASGYGDSDRYGEAEYKETQYASGGRREEYSRHEEDSRGTYGYQQKVETSSYGGGGGYERTEERRYESGDQWRSEEKREGFDSSGQYYKKEKKHKGKYSGDEGSEDEDKKYKKKDKYRGKYSGDEDSEDGGKKYKKDKGKYSGDEESEDEETKRRKKELKKREKEEKKYKKHGGRDDDDSDDYKRGGSKYGEERRYGETQSGYGQERGYGETPSYGGGETYSRGTEGNSTGGYGGQQESYGRPTESYAEPYGAGGVPGGFSGEQQPVYERQQEGGYSRQQEGSYGRQDEGGYGGETYGEEYGGRRRDEGEYGGGYGRDY